MDTPLVAMRARNPHFAGTLWPKPFPHVLLAMQKVEGSTPFSRFVEGLHLQAFFMDAVGLCVCFAPDQPDQVNSSNAQELPANRHVLRARSMGEWPRVSGFSPDSGLSAARRDRSSSRPHRSLSRSLSRAAE